jgi:hypothetical protein
MRRASANAPQRAGAARWKVVMSTPSAKIALSFERQLANAPARQTARSGCARSSMTLSSVFGAGNDAPRIGETRRTARARRNRRGRSARRREEAPSVQRRLS